MPRLSAIVITKNLIARTRSMVPLMVCAPDGWIRTPAEVIAINLKLAPKLGHRVEPDGSFSDPASGITILQGYVTAAPDYIIPGYPTVEDARPHPIEPETIGKDTFKLFVRGQSLAANCGHGRYAARNTDITCVYADGHFYPCSDPIVGADGPAAAYGRGLPIP